MENLNFRHIATQIGDNIKYAKSVNEIDRLGQAILRVVKESFPNSAITSVRAKVVYDWILSLGKAELESTERIKRLINFCVEITPENDKRATIEFLEKLGCPYNILYKDDLDEFLKRNFHPEVVIHSKKLFIQRNYFHAVFEASKVFNKMVKEKARSDKDGTPLMLSVLSSENGVVRIKSCETQTDKDFQDGVKFISGGLMSAIRNSTAHEPAIEWPIDKNDCLDILSLISFLFRQLDKSVYFSGKPKS